MKPIYCFLLFCCSAFAQASAMTPEEAKQAYARGDYAEAAPTLKSLADKAPKNASANTMAGIALAKSGNTEDAKRYLARGTNEAKLTLAEIAFDNYDFGEAEELVEKYIAAQKKARKSVSQEVENRLSRIRTIGAMLDRVEKIVIIDSIAVPKETFFEAYNLAPSAGSVQGAASLPKSFNAAEGSTYFSSDNNSTVIWSVSTGNFPQLAQTWMLADGSWEEPQPLGATLNEGGAADYPFLMSDGVTLYYANNGENSIGGYDIFISRFDGEKFLQPQNIGMPYNSPYDDYLLAIDEETGIGWWATDRNQLGDYITIYKFIPQELRVNYPVDTENLAGLAKLTDYKRTWEKGKDYSALIAASNDLPEWEETISASLKIAMPDGRALSVSQLTSPQAKSLVPGYASLLTQLKNKETLLQRMRKEYSFGYTADSSAIIDAENDMNDLRKEIINLRNKIIKSEMANK